MAEVRGVVRYRGNGLGGLDADIRGVADVRG